MEKIDLKKLSSLSPFELKNYLIDIASRNGSQMLLNAGRGNPNFLTLEPRQAFIQLSSFAVNEAENSFSYLPYGIGGTPNKKGIEDRFNIFMENNKCQPGVRFLKKALSYVKNQLGLCGEEFIYELVIGCLGCNYPVPDRITKFTDKVVNQYIRKEMIGKRSFKGEFDLFAVEGGTAAIAYIFNTLKENFFIKPGDHIALGMPIFTPYIEIPKLNDYKLIEVNIESESKTNWQFTKKELDKLRDPKIKAFFLVNPSNPSSVKISDESLEYIAEIVKERPDLLILTDDVYGTFADNFTSLFAICPQNTILVYSYSKYFGATGWRLGVIAIHENNILDAKIAKLPKDKAHELTERYESVSTDPAHFKFIDRLVADSRAVGLNHTAGLALPAQVQMTLFSLFSLMDPQDNYKSVLKKLLHNRKDALYRHIKAKPVADPNSVDYYHIYDYEIIAKQEYGDEFAKWFLKNINPNDFVFQLADKASIVLLPGGGFGTTHPSARVSLANLDEYQYVLIGKATEELMAAYYEKFTKSKSKK